jgi:hypothetical protein
MPEGVEMPKSLFEQSEAKSKAKETKVKEEVQEKPKQKQTKEIEKETSIDTFIKSLELSYDETLVNNALENIHVSLASGEQVTMGEYENLIAYKVVQYIRLGVGWKVTQMLREQNGKGETLALKWVLKEMAEKELLYALKPIEHVIPLMGNVYITIAGRKFYARSTGQSYSVTYKESKNGNDDNIWSVDCILTVKDREGNESVFEGQGHASPSDVTNKKWIKDMAYKRALADALESAFPIGVSYEKSTMIQDFEESRTVQNDQQPELVASADNL